MKNSALWLPTTCEYASKLRSCVLKLRNPVIPFHRKLLDTDSILGLSHFGLYTTFWVWNVTGLLHTNRFGEIEGGKARVGCYEEVLNTGNLSKQELLQLDREGRCLVTDHGSFGKLSLWYFFRYYILFTGDWRFLVDAVLFNLYGPNVGPDDEERYDFKLNFYLALQVCYLLIFRFMVTFLIFL